jgi:hypothetical protein
MKSLIKTLYQDTTFVGKIGVTFQLPFILAVIGLFYLAVWIDSTNFKIYKSDKINTNEKAN